MLFRERPSFAAELLTRLLGHALPSYSDVQIGEADFTQLQTTEFRADLVVVHNRDKIAVHGVVVEVQLEIDKRKLETWPVYGTTLRARHHCPVVVLVVSPDPKVAAWASQPIALGGESYFRPKVIGPDSIPRVSTLEEAQRDVELAILSCVAYGRDTEIGPAIALAASAALTVAAGSHAAPPTGGAAAPSAAIAGDGPLHAQGRDHRN